MNCTPANAIPHTATAGRTPRSPLQPHITPIMYAGMNNDTGAQIRPTPALSRSSGRPVVMASVVIGVAMDPKATGAVFASRQTAAAVNGENPSPASIDAATAPGVPNPAQPSMK